MNDLFCEKVLKVVAQILDVAGQIAQLIGYPRHARQVGKVSVYFTKAVTYPCHRLTLLVAWF